MSQWINKLRVKRSQWLLVLCFSVSLSAMGGEFGGFKKQQKRPNILMIAVDDLNHWLGHLGRNTQVKTPYIDALAARGMSFHRAYSPSAICNATRAAMMTGMRPSTTGVYRNGIDWRYVVGKGLTLPEYLRDEGYHVMGAGKIFHTPKSIRREDWHEYYDGKRKYALEGDDLTQPQTKKTLAYKAGFLPIKELAGGDDTVEDYHVARWSSEKIQKEYDKPFFMAVGIFRPHLPWNVPAKYFDLYPEDGIELPPYNENDLDDLPTHTEPVAEHKKILEQGSWKKAVRAYMASITYADRQVGRVLEALENSPNKDNTIIVLWGDHGWHLGEKLRWRKFALWEEATRTPYIWVAPGTTKPGTQTETPVDLQSLWPTLAALVGGKRPEHIEGESLVPLLKKPNKRWSVPAITTQGFNNHAVRWQDYRYIRYNKGAEELYDHQDDPYEWNNLAGKKASQVLVDEAKTYLPKINRDAAEGHNIYKGDKAFSKEKTSKMVVDG